MNRGTKAKSKRQECGVPIKKGDGVDIKNLWRPRCTEFADYIRWIAPAFPQMPDAQRVVALGQANSGFVKQQIAVVELRRCPGQSTVQEQLPGCRFQQICAAHDLSDFHFGIVDHHRQLIRRNVIAPPNHEIAEIAASEVKLLAEVKVGETDFLTIGHPKPPVHSCRHIEVRCIGPRTAAPRIKRLIINIVRSACRLCQVFAGAGTRIDETCIPQAAPRGEIVLPPLALGVRRVRPAAIRAFIPSNSQPTEVFDHRVNKLCPAALRIKVVVAENQGSFLLNCPLGRDPEATRVAEMQQTGRRRRQSSPIFARRHAIILSTFFSVPRINFFSASILCALRVSRCSKAQNAEFAENIAQRKTMP